MLRLCGVRVFQHYWPIVILFGSLWQVDTGSLTRAKNLVRAVNKKSRHAGTGESAARSDGSENT